MIKTIQQVKLIDGVFTRQEARDMINNLIDAKINLHLIRKLSHEEHFDGIDVASKKRIEELKLARKKFKEFLLHETDDDSKIRINSMIDVTIDEE